MVTLQLHSVTLSLLSIFVLMWRIFYVCFIFKPREMIVNAFNVNLLCSEACLFLGRSKSLIHLKNLFLFFKCDYFWFHWKCFLKALCKLCDWIRGLREKHILGNYRKFPEMLPSIFCWQTWGNDLVHSLVIILVDWQHFGISIMVSNTGLLLLEYRPRNWVGVEDAVLVKLPFSLCKYNPGC